ncbi:16S rRNA (guanine(966)-N(2))-methyltransferase RsmD [Desulfofundulus kuznetsovii]|uniref:16S rRNA (guanine(966)-N(2))-methyltransferase RsmD n=1 Tax=Desulfofundulus kuznetsovii TaxID=58135 RepID=UPI00338F7928
MSKILRVIAGVAKKSRLKIPRGWSGRPTADRVKESLFNILGPRIPGSHFLDLYAGTGNVGIEALSRGAARVVFVERDKRAVKIIRDNLVHVGLAERAEVLAQDVFLGLRQLSGQQFDVVFLDPPYGQGLELPTLEAIDRHGLPARGGIVVAESSKRQALPGQVGRLVQYRQHQVGDTMLSFYQPGIAGEED